MLDVSGEVLELELEVRGSGAKSWTKILPNEGGSVVGGRVRCMMGWVRSCAFVVLGALVGFGVVGR